MIVATEGSFENNFALILCIDDSDLSLIESSPDTLNNAEFLIGLLNKRGKHAMIFRLQLVDRNDILKHVKRLFLRGFETVSWVHQGRFFKKENPDARPAKCKSVTSDVRCDSPVDAV